MVDARRHQIITFVNKKYRVAMIGYGWVSTAHIQAINATSTAKVAAIYSSRPQDSAALSAQYGSPIEATQDLDGLLRREDIHAVSICSYPHQHAAHAIAAAKAGKHIIMEKPIALSLGEAAAVAAAVEQAGVKVCVCFECRFSNQLQSTKAVIEAGLLGSIHYGEVDYYHGIGPWYGQYRWNRHKKDGGSSLLSAGCHAMDALLFCMEGEVQAVTSYAARSSNPSFASYEYPTTSVSLLKFSDGRIGKVASVIDCIQPYYFHTHLVGSEGSLLDNKFHSSRLGLNKEGWSGLSMTLLDSGDVSDHPYQTQFEAFFAALERGDDMPLTSLRDGLRTHRTVLAADMSAELGREVQLKELS